MQKIINNIIKNAKAHGQSLKLNRGFTLLFASLIGALVIAIGMAILNITLKQIILASAGRESQQAFYSADAGVECALYLDRGAGDVDCRLGLFGAPSTTPTSGITVCGLAYTAGTPVIGECFGKEITFIPTSLGASGDQSQKIQSSFILDANSVVGPDNRSTNNNMCFNVTVLKTADTIATKGSTIIESRGYNNCNAGITNKFERAIRTVNQ